MINNPERNVDLRSDTVKMPTQEMLESIRYTPLGDDVYREDPTVNMLEELAAKKMGKDAALLVTSGTQANLVSLLSNTKRGDEVIVESEAHIYFYEVGGMSAIGGVIPRPVKGKMGILDPEDIEREIRQPNIHFPQTSLICIENTHNRAGGTIFPPEQIEDMHEVAKRHNLRLYMDGARIFNAAVALEVDVKAFTKHVDNLMFCLSKGLGAPIGSIVVGDSDFVERARKFRKMLGGGMRQAGVIASPGIIALEKMVDRLKEDHYNARILAEGLSKIEGISIDPRAVQTNIVALDIGGLGISSEKFIGVIKEGGVKVNALDSKRVRMVTHIGITTDDIKYALSVIEEISKKQKQRLS